jgi:phage terminase large subunit-like protein
METKTRSRSSVSKRKKAEPVAGFVFPQDEATAYALAVVAGDEMAGPYVRDACRRHLKDLETAHTRGLVWSVPHVERVLKFFRQILCLNGGDFEGKPFDPLPWQCFILGNLFGWLRLEPGNPHHEETVLHPDTIVDLCEAGALYRRFRVAYQETGKGSGKSPLAAGIGLYMMLADNEPRAEIYAAATKKDQAMILFRDAVAMVDQSKALASRIKKSGKAPNVWNLSHLKSHSFFRPISADDGQSGPRPHCALLDEVHEHKGPHVVEMLRAGFKFRKQPLMFMITNSGADKTSVCYDYHEYGAKVCAGSLVDDEFFAYISAHDKDEDPFDPAVQKYWKKSNPSLGHTLKESYLQGQVTQARGMPSKESTVRRLNFCQWTQSYDPWISSEVWSANSEAPVPLVRLRGARCTAGLDLSSKNDLSALVFTFEHDDGTVSVHPFFYTPEEGIVEKERKDRVPYTTWARQGFITLVPGNVIDYGYIAEQLREIIDDHELEVLNFDRWKIDDFKRECAKVGLEWPEDEGPLRPHGQGYKDMNPSIEATEDLLTRGLIRHGNHPVLTWCVSNAVVTKDPTELRKFDKVKATGRIDGAVALVMGVRGLSSDTEAGDLDDFLSNPIIIG